ncbi:hypothetical protein ACF1G5_28200 [Streptomyces coeruleorubidus]|uniref:hypothetical protein n=1 Tax=Streptomyces coeruleorubidus TaxID=116188 RepID=UPI0036F94806
MENVRISAGRGRDWLLHKGYPVGDGIEMAASPEQYDGGGQYGVEIPVINSYRELLQVTACLDEAGITVTRYNETHGSILLSDAELKDMFALCRDRREGILISLGPRPEYDVKSTFYRTPFGLEMGRQINNHDAFRACVEETVRLADLGCRGIIVYDLGVARVLAEMREDGALPSDLVLKTSSHCMATNPFLARIFAENGADSITTAHDLGLPVLQEMRRLSPGLPLDVPIDVYRTKGGFIRFYEAAEIVQIAAPVMLKIGASAQGHPYDTVSDATTRERVARVARTLEMLDRFLPERSYISNKSRHCCIPV